MQTAKRTLALFLVLILVAGIIPQAEAADPAKNDCYRHITSHTLSQQAEDYYTGTYTWDRLCLLQGKATSSSLAAMDSPLYEALQDLMGDTMTNSVSYRSLTSYWPYTDTQPGFSDATLFYSDCDGSGYNREHVWPKSRASFYQNGGGSDLHPLRPTDITVNSTRGNMTMGNVRGVVSGYSTCSYGGRPVLYYSTGSDLVEVNDDIKGDVARIFLYVYVRWGQPNLCETVPAAYLPRLDSDDSVDDGLKVMESLDTLLQWCAMDPVDTWEMTRNDRCQDVQGNRNVFIDYPELAWMLFGRDIPSDMDTPSGYAKNQGGSSYTITVKVNDPAMGTASLSGTRITAAPAAGYYAESLTLSPVGSAQVQQQGNVFTLSGITCDLTATVNFAPRQVTPVTYVVPQGVTVVNPVTSAYVGDSVLLPSVSGTPADQSHEYTFIGWAEQPVEPTTQAVTAFAPGVTYPVNQPRPTFYALYSYAITNGQGDSNIFQLVTEAPADWSGEYVMTGIDGGTEYVHLADGTGVGTTGACLSLSSADIRKQDSTLSNVTASYIIEVEKQGSSYSMRLKGASTPTYLYYSGSGNSLSVSSDPSDAGSQWTFSLKSGTVDVINAGTTGRHLQFNRTAGLFRCYTSGQTPVCLYAAGGAAEIWYLTLGQAECPHSHTEVQGAIQAECVTPGYSGDRVCTDCGTILVPGIVTPALGHYLTGWSVTIAPTCTEEGEERQACLRCFFVEARTVPALGHQDVSTTVEATCETGGYTILTCTRCGSSCTYEQTAPLGHDPVPLRLDVPTCTAPGLLIQKCSRCGLETSQALDPLGCPSGVFTDAPKYGSWAHEGVDFVIREGLFSGVSSTQFAPKGQMNRAMLVTVLWRHAGKPAAQGSEFSDVKSSAWYAGAVAWASETGLVNGVGGGRFDPDGPITREQLALILYRYAQSLGCTAGSTADLSEFADLNSLHSWAREAMEWAVARELVSGTVSGGRRVLSPLGSATREQTAAILMRFVQSLG